MNSLDAAFHGMWTVAFLWRFGSFVTTKMSNKGEEPGMVPGGTIWGFFGERQCNVSLWWEAWREHFSVKLSTCCSFWSRLLSVILGFFFLLKSSFVTFREEVLKTLLLMSSCCDCKESTIFSGLRGFIFSLKANLYYSWEEVLHTFVHTVEIDLHSPEPFVPF